MKIGLQQFELIYGKKPTHCFTAPSSVNLVGDYLGQNGGNILAVGISLGCKIYCRPNNTNILSIVDTYAKQKAKFDYSKLSAISKHPNRFAFHPLSKVCSLLAESSVALVGVDCLVELEFDFILSQSVALQVATMYMFLYFHNSNTQNSEVLFDEIRLDKIATNPTTTYHKIANYLTSYHSTKDFAMLIDSNTLTYQYTPAKIDDYTFCILNPTHPQGQTSTMNRQRYQQCQDALSFINAKLTFKSKKPLDNLCAIPPQQFEHLAFGIDKTLYKRARHCVYEQQRIYDATVALANGDTQKLGQLMSQSHQSMSYLYQIVPEELDTICEIMSSFEHSLGCKMTSDGYCVALVKKDTKRLLQKHFIKEYKKRTGDSISIYYGNLCDGAGRIPLDKKIQS